MPGPSRLLRFSTEMLPERERFSVFREDFARRIMRTDAIDNSGTFMGLGPVATATLVSTPAEFIRHEDHVKDGNDDLMLTIVETGAVHYTHAGKEHLCKPSLGYFSDNGRPRRGIGKCHSSVRNIIVRAIARSRESSSPPRGPRVVQCIRIQPSSCSTVICDRSRPSNNPHRSNWLRLSAFTFSTSLPQRSGRPPKLQKSLRSAV